MKLTTTLTVSKAVNPIDYDATVISIGSCFAENMAEKLSHFGFQSTANPFGILFSPAAIEKSVSFAVKQKEFTESDIFFHNERWHCFDVHSDLSSHDHELHLRLLNEATALMHQKIKSATHFIITIGTAWAYRNTMGDLVANCHKVPQKEFSKELLSIDSIHTSLQNIAHQLRFVNPDIQLIFTVSPVRHLKDGFVENQRSKAHLIAALHRFLSEEDAGSYYFPAYEIMMDELRDYRFYAADMLHPNATAIDYIWEKFSAAWMADHAFPIMKEIESIRHAAAHRPFNPESEAHRLFLDKLERQKATLVQKHPQIRL